jgi:hypothetical protein
MRKLSVCTIPGVPTPKTHTPAISRKLMRQVVRNQTILQPLNPFSGKKQVLKRMHQSARKSFDRAVPVL